jgi:hypothetical protein
LIYCGHTALNPDGFVKDAAAGDTCCGATAPVFTTLFDASVANNTATPPIAVGAYRQVVVYNVPSGPLNLPNSCDIYVQFRPDAAHPFGFTGQFQTAGSFQSGGMLHVDASDLMLVDAGPQTCHLVVAGVQ